MIAAGELRPAVEALLPYYDDAYRRRRAHVA